MNLHLLSDEFVGSLNNIEKKKHLLKIRIINELYLNGEQTNHQLRRELSISTPTSIGLLNELMAEGTIEKKGRGKSSGGRKPDLFTLKKNAFFLLAIHLEKYKAELAIFNNHHENISGTRTFSLPLSKGVDIADPLYAQASQVIRASGIDPMQLLGVGINMPGLVDAEAGINYTYAYTKEGTLRASLETKFERPVFIENDAKARTLAEHRFGLARNKNDILAIFLDWGIGLGIIREGTLYRGANGFAGEFGHIPVLENGQLCTCGKQGCLETVASGTALVKMAEEGRHTKKSSIFKNMSEDDDCKPDLYAIIEAAVSGDQYAVSLISEVGFHLGKGISVLIQLFNPELIILGGKIAEAKQYLIIPVMQALNTYCIPQLAEKTSIQVSNVGHQSGILGSVAVVMENLFKKYQ